MNTGARLGALRFMLGLAAGQVEFDSAEEREASLREAVAYLVGFVRPLVQLLLAARCTAAAARRSTGWVTGSDTWSGVRWRLTRPMPQGSVHVAGRMRLWHGRSKWMGRRSLREVWQGGRMSHQCFRAWRTYVLASGPRAWAVRQGLAFGECPDIVRAEWCGEDEVAGACGPGDGVRSFEAWQLALAFAEWSAAAACSVPASRPRRTVSRLTGLELLQGLWSLTGQPAAVVVARAMLGLRAATEAARRRRTSARAAAEAVLDELIGRVVGGKQQGVELYASLLGHDGGRKRQRPRSSSASEVVSDQSGDDEEDEAVAPGGGSGKEVPEEGVLRVDRTVTGALRVLLKRKAGDEWVAYGALRAPVKAVVNRWERRTLPRRGAASVPKPSGPRRSLTSVGKRAGVPRFRRLVRGTDVLRRRLRGWTCWLASRRVRVGPEWALPEELAASEQEMRMRSHPPVVTDDLEDMWLRGDGWRVEGACGGRGVKRKTR